MIVVVDYNTGNMGSIVNMIKKIGYRAITSSNVDEIEVADKIILPGVGSFDQGIKNLKNLGILEVLSDKVIQKKTPVLGICLGMQLMTKKSEEGTLSGLGWIDAEVRKFQSEVLKVPHMGWNTARLEKQSKLFSDTVNEKRYYFVHSYYVRCNNMDDILTSTEYTHNFVSAFEKDNIIAVQFHPEKSHKFGMELIRNFVENY